jgi:hypothetical protein
VDNKTWLEPLLRESLGRVKAPHELWDRVQAGSLPGTKRSTERPGYRLLWSLAGASVVTASVMAVAWGYNPAAAQPEFRLRSAAPQTARTVTCFSCHTDGSI